MVFHYSNGNEKCEYFNWGLPTGTTCPGAIASKCGCPLECYANNSENQYSDVLRQHEENLKLWLENPQEFERQLDEALDTYEAECKRNGEKPYARPSQSGDMPSKAYARMLMRVFDKHPNIMFFFFTKNYMIWDFIEELPFWKIPNCNLMLSEWGCLKPTTELRKYYQVANAIDIYDLDKTEKAGYQHCNGKCRECNICKSKTGGDCYFIKHGCRVSFKIPDTCKRKEKIDVHTPGFYKFGGKTINGINLNYCKANGINTYDGRVKKIKEIWQMMECGELVVYKNGYVVKA